MRGINHIRQGDNAVALCGRELTSKPVEGRPVCPRCADELIKVVNQNTNSRYWQLPNQPKHDRALSS